MSNMEVAIGFGWKTGGHAARDALFGDVLAYPIADKVTQIFVFHGFIVGMAGFSRILFFECEQHKCSGVS